MELQDNVPVELLEKFSVKILPTQIPMEIAIGYLEGIFYKASG